jgi:hypothetical protein
MATENTEKKTSQEELLKAVADVLDEALAIYETEVGSSGDMKKAQMGIDDAMDVSGGMQVKPKPVSTPGIGDASTAGIMAKEGDKEDKKDKEKESEEEEDDDKLMATYKSLITKMEKRGLMAKVEKAAEKPSMKKSEEAGEQFSDLRKSFDDRFEALAKTVQNVAETVKKIAAQPKERKGLAGYQPLKKNEGPAPLRKGELVGKLLELKKSGDPRVDTTFITRVEQGRLMKGDDEKLKALGILSE